VSDPPAGADARADLVAKLVHEVRGPVSTLRGLAGTALAHYDGLSDDERREFLDLLRQEAERLEATVEQVALAMRLDAGTVGFDLRPSDLPELVRAAVARVDVGAHPVAVDADGPLEAVVDAARLTTVVEQLVRNAVTYSPADAPIAVRLRREGGEAILEVLDAGPGIPRERRAEVVERFAGWRPPGYETAPGAGLGLFIATRVVGEHGGSISIEDGPEGGTMLAVRLPLEGARGTGGDDAPDL
jgi:signal transduction histidine kinase